MAETSYLAAARQLVADVPDLAPALDEHLGFYSEFLLHVFFGDVSRYADDVARARDSGKAARLASALETMANRYPDTDNALQVSFIEWFLWGDEEEQSRYEWLKQFTGPRMLALTREFIEMYE
jgi:hypothetical protein